MVGTDAITVGFIYKPATVTPVSSPVIVDDVAFTDPNGTGQQRNRPAIAQTFIDGNGGLDLIKLDFGNGLRVAGGNTFRYPVQNSGAGGVLTYGPGLAAFASGNFAVDNPLGETFDNGSFANTWFANQGGVIFCTTCKNLDNTLDLGFAPDDGIKLLFFGHGSQVGGELIDQGCFGLFFSRSRP